MCSSLNSMAPTLADVPGLADAYPDTRNSVLADRFGLTPSQLRRIAHQHGYKKAPGFRGRILREAYLASIPAAEDRRVPFPRYPGPDYCAKCGLTNSHLEGCKSVKRVWVETAAIRGTVAA